jgi:transposase InsO family protein
VNPPYTTEHNGKIERYHKTMKREFFWKYIKADEDFESIRYKYQLWLYEYNYKRKHSGLKMFGCTPAQKLASACLESFNLLIPIVRRVDFSPSNKDFILVT